VESGLDSMKPFWSRTVSAPNRAAAGITGVILL